MVQPATRRRSRFAASPDARRYWIISSSPEATGSPWPAMVADVLEWSFRESTAISTTAARDKEGKQRNDRYDGEIDNEQPAERQTAQEVVLHRLGGRERLVIRCRLVARDRGLALAKAPAGIRAECAPPSPSRKL